ncbi:MAG: putative type II secretion system protein E [Microgenomates group bacterium Gr01-1014_7]|nr:MAG: putative type II secretion system protein E [Microgenomates group bacterium Gr01-1014_7]
MAAQTTQGNAIEDILLEQGLLTPDQVSAIKLESINSGQAVDRILLHHNIVPMEKIAQAKARILNVPFVKLEGKAISTDVLNLIPEPAARRYRIIPFEKSGDELWVAMEDPLDIQIIQFVEKRSGMRTKPFLALTDDILKAIGDQYAQNLTTDVTSALREVESVQPEQVLGVGPEIIREAPVSNIINQLLEYAIKSRASDIHIEPQEDRTRVRYRIDGILQEKILLPKGVHEALVSRIKILSVLKIDEKRLPQDGRFTFTYGQAEVDLRVSIIPTVFGEKVVLRLLPKSSAAPTLLELGLRGASLKALEAQLLRTHGIILICGPTGSGKTTTLYSILAKISTSKVNVVTIEDPVEYQIPGVNQAQVNPGVGLTFASALRSFLRQDPNIIMVGEVRDTETAELAIQAALTGHQVFSTVHTNSASGAPPRLLDMGVEPFLLTSALNCAVGQRVVRKICTYCKVEFSALPEVMENFKQVLGKFMPPASASTNLSKGKGCKYCGNTGYLGRIGIFEVLVITDQIAKLVLEHAASNSIEEAAVGVGMITMKQDGYLKALEGVTTLEEVLRVAQD